MAESMAESIRSLYSSGSQAKKKVTLDCICDESDGSFDLALSPQLVKNLDGFYLYKFAIYPGPTAPTDASDLTITATTTELNFDAGEAAFVENELVTGAGGATGYVRRIVVQSGAWATDDAAGYMVLSQRNSTAFVNDEAITGSKSGVAVANGADGTAKSIDILGGNGTNAVDATTTVENVPELSTPSLNFYNVMDKDNLYTVSIANNSVNSATVIIELIFVQ